MSAGISSASLPCRNRVPLVIFRAAILVTHLCRADEDVTSVRACGAAACFVSAIIPDIEVGAEPIPIVTLGAFHSLAVMNAGADLQGEVHLRFPWALADGGFPTSARASFSFVGFAPALRRMWDAGLSPGLLPRLPWSLGTTPLVGVVQICGVVERPLVVRQELCCLYGMREKPCGIVDVVPPPSSSDV